jgi:methionyl aminopeptidase
MMNPARILGNAILFSFCKGLMISKKYMTGMRNSSKATALVLDYIQPFVKPGITTNELDKLCEDFIRNTLKAKPANVGYNGYPKAICTSVDSVIVHGIPNDDVLIEGSIINVDVAVILDGYYGDSSRTFPVGKISDQNQKLIDETYIAMWRAIKLVKPGLQIGDIGAEILEHATQSGYSVVGNYCGHGIGRRYHMDPQIPNIGARNTGAKLKQGMIFTIEPLLNIGLPDNHVLEDGWTVVADDGLNSAHFEHTIMVTESGFEVLTLGWREDPPTL